MGYVYIVLPLTGILMIYYSIMFIINATGDLPESTGQVEIKSVD